MSIGYFQWTKIGCFRWTRSGCFRRTLTTAKANGLEPYAYLLQALTELPYLGKSPSQEELNAFLSWSAKMQAACAARNTTTAGDLC